MWLVLYSCLSPANNANQPADHAGTDSGDTERPEDDSGDGSETDDSATSGLDDSASGDTADTSDTDLGICEWMSWNNVGQPFFKTWCTACHSADLPEDERQGAPLTCNLDSYAGVLAWSPDVEAKLLIGSMPPTGTPPDDLRDAVVEWLDCGAPE